MHYAFSGFCLLGANCMSDLRISSVFAPILLLNLFSDFGRLMLDSVIFSEEYLIFKVLCEEILIMKYVFCCCFGLAF